MGSDRNSNGSEDKGRAGSTPENPGPDGHDDVLQAEDVWGSTEEESPEAETRPSDTLRAEEIWGEPPPPRPALRREDVWGGEDTQVAELDPPLEEIHLDRDFTTPEGAPRGPALRQIDLREPQEPTRAERRARLLQRARPWARVVVIGIAVLAVLDTAYVGIGLARSLYGVEATLTEGKDLLVEGRYGDAKRRFSEAAADSRTAEGLMGHLPYVVATHLPWLGSDARTVESLTSAVRISSGAGLDAVGAFAAMGAPPGGLAGALYDDGAIRLDAAAKALPFVDRADASLRRAVSVVEDAPQPHIGFLVDALAGARADVASARETSHKVGVLMRALPSLFGGEGRRSYLLIFQNPSESRGSGGSADYYGVLEADDGSLDLGEVRPVDQLPSVAADVDAPRWFSRQYGSLGALSDWGSVNYSPTFTTVSSAELDLYRAATGRSLDGVLAMDPVSVGLLTRVTGPLVQEGFNVQLDSKNTARVLMHDIYTHFAGDQSARDAYVTGVIEQLWDILTSGGADVSRLAGSLGEAVPTQHIKVYATNAGDANALNELEADGDLLVNGSNVQMLFHNNVGGNKVDYFLQREVATSVELNEDGGARVTVSATFHNEAPSGPASLLLGEENPGTNDMRLSMLLPREATLERFTTDGAPSEAGDGLEQSNPLVTTALTITPGETSRVRITYSLPDAIRLGPEGGQFQFSSFPQATAQPDEVSVTVIPPRSLDIVEPSGIGLLGEDGEFRVTGGPDVARDLRLQLLPS